MYGKIKSKNFKIFLIQRKKVAIKCLKKSVVLTTEDGVEDVFKERRILELKYPFKCSLRYAFQDKKNLYIGNLYKLLNFISTLLLFA